MKKLLLAAVFGALCMSDASAVHSFLQSKSSKNTVDTQNKAAMGQYYKGMVGLVNAMFMGWADTFALSAKDPEFASCKTQLNEASKRLKAMAKLTGSILNRDRDNTTTRHSRAASAAMQAFSSAITSLTGTPYWNHAGAQLRFSVIVTTNALRALVYPGVLFNLAGAKWSSQLGITSALGLTNDVCNAAFNTASQMPSQSSRFNEMTNSFNMLTQQVAPAVIANAVASTGTMGAATTNYATTGYNYSTTSVATAPAAAAGRTRR